MAARLQRAAAFVGIADRILLRAEEIAVQDTKMLLPALDDRPPVAGTDAPRRVAVTDGVEAPLRGLAANRLVAHVLHAARAARDEHVTHDALVVDAEGRAVDGVAEI